MLALGETRVDLAYQTLLVVRFIFLIIQKRRDYIRKILKTITSKLIIRKGNFTIKIKYFYIRVTKFLPWKAPTKIIDKIINTWKIIIKLGSLNPKFSRKK